MLPIIAKLAKAGSRIKEAVKNRRQDESGVFANISLSKVVAGIVILAVLFIVFKKAKAAYLKWKTNDLRKIRYDKSRLSHPESDYSNLASSFEAAMDYSGTDEQTVFDALDQIRNQDDWNYMLDVFGIREKHNAWPEPNITGNLKIWLVDEFGGEERERINNIFKQRNIKF